MCCDYRKLNQKLPADFWSYDKEERRIVKQGINTPYPLPCIDKMLTTIRGKQFLMTLNCMGAFHGLKLSPDAAKKSAFLTPVECSTFQTGTTSIILQGNARNREWP